jgi:hypothetical protein
MRTKRALKIILWATLALSVLAIVAAFLPLPPHGRFATPNLCCGDDSYFEFKGGKYWQVVIENGKEQRQFIGLYHKENGRWLVDAGDGKPSQICATLFSLEFIGRDGRGYPFHRHW